MDFPNGKRMHLGTLQPISLLRLEENPLIQCMEVNLILTSSETFNWHVVGSKSR